MNVVAIIPTLDEEAGIAEVIAGFKTIGINKIIVADGGSSDKTCKIAKENGAEIIAVPRGKGNGFRKALNSIKIEDNATYIMIDGDASYDSKESTKLLELIKDFDVVTGQRNLLIHDVTSAVHVLGNLLISVFGSVAFFKWNPDICTGFWTFKGSALKQLRDKLTAEKFELEADLFSSLCKMGLKHKSIPISYVKRKGESKLRTRDAFKILFKMIKARLSK